MTIQIARPGTIFVYQVDPDNPRVIQRSKEGKRYSWKDFRLCKDADEARQAILKLNSKKEAKR